MAINMNKYQSRHSKDSDTGQYIKGKFWTKEKIVAEIKKIYAMGIPPNWMNLYEHMGLKGMVTAGCQQFGSWKEALIASGINPDDVRGKTFDKEIDPTKTCKCGCGMPVTVGSEFYKGAHSLRLQENRTNMREVLVERWKDVEYQTAMSNAHLGNEPWNKDKVCPSMGGEHHWNWQGGKTEVKYPAEFNRVLRNQIRERDNQTCQICKCQDSEMDLDVHHIDSNKGNNQMNNLVALCRKCHIKLHMEENALLEVELEILRSL